MKSPAPSEQPILDEETEMNGEPHGHDDFYVGVAIASTAETASADQAAIDQVLRLVAEYHNRLGTDLGRTSAAPSLSVLRRSPLGRKLRRLSAVGRGDKDAVAATVRRDDLFCPATAAERLNLDRRTIERWLDDGTLDSVRDETGSRFIPAQTIERLRDVARVLQGPTWSPPASATDADLVA